MKDENPYKEYYYMCCVNCSNKICKDEVYNEKFHYNAHKKKIIQDCAEVRRIITIIKGD